MDTIASGIEASPWGFSAFGYAPFVHASPDNTVLALARYWEMQVALALDWQQKMPEACIQLRYEDLVRTPESALSRIFAFLDVDDDPTVLTHAFASFNPASGPGDYKLAFTNAVTSASIGRGKQVPVALIPDALRDRLNELLAQAGYVALTDSWNAEPRTDTTVEHQARNELLRLMGSSPARPWHCAVETIAIVADDDPELRWIVQPHDGSVYQGDGEVDVVLTGAAHDIVRMIKGSENPGVLLRAGKIRYVRSGQDHAPLRQWTQLVSSLVQHLAEPGGP
jgi:hypothetical protein